MDGAYIWSQIVSQKNREAVAAMSDWKKGSPTNTRQIEEKQSCPTIRQISSDAKVRKNTPITTGVLDYFPLAMAEIARVSKAGNDQHNPGQSLHWAREKSTDHADCIVRHLLDRGTLDSDGQRHSAKVAWRALALLQIELEGENK